MGRIGLTLTLLVGILAGGACSGMRATRFVDSRFNFAFMERVAVLPFENLTNDKQAGARATRLFITELLAARAVDVVEPGEVNAALNRISGGRAPSTEEVIALGKALKVQGIILGSVGQSELVRSGGASAPVVTVDVHMVETETGTAVWAATHTERGGSFGGKVFGTGSEPISETTRRCVRRLVKTLVR